MEIELTKLDTLILMYYSYEFTQGLPLVPVVSVISILLPTLVISIHWVIMLVQGL